MTTLTTAFHRVSLARSHQPLSDEAIYRVAPSIFADQAHDSRSPRYTHIPTGTVLQEPQRPPLFNHPPGA